MITPYLFKHFSNCQTSFSYSGMKIYNILVADSKEKNNYKFSKFIRHLQNQIFSYNTNLYT